MNYKPANFGLLKETVYKKLVADKNKELFKKFLGVIRENKSVKKFYDVFYLLENTVYEDKETAKLFLENLLKTFDQKDIDKFLVEMRSFDSMKKVCRNEKPSVLHEHIQRVILERKMNPSNMTKFFESYQIVLNNLTAKKGENINEDVYDEKTLEIAKTLLEDKYFSKLDESQRKIVEIFSGDDEIKKEREFKKLRENLLLDIENKMFNEKEQENFKIYKESYEKIFKMQYQKPDDFFVLYELKG